MHGTETPSPWVQRWSHLVPAGAPVLDVACGAGRHMRWFAGRGHAVTGIDRAPEAVAAAGAFGEALQADLEDGSPWPLPGRTFGCVVVTNYLWRPVFPALQDSVAPGGVLIYETFTIDQASRGRPRNPAFLLQHDELVTLVAPLRIVRAREGDFDGKFVASVAAIR